MILVVAGVPGSGKTTLSVRLSRLLGLDYVSLAELALEEGVWLDYDWSHRTFIVDPLRLVSSLRRRIRRGARVVIEATEVMSIWEAGVEPSLVVVTRCKPPVLYERLRWRHWPREKLLENLEAELVGVVAFQAKMLFGERRVCEVDTTRVSPEAAARMVLDAIGGVSKCQDIDWLASSPESVEFVAKLSG